MREKLALLKGQRREFAAIFSRYGHKRYWKDMKKTILLTHVTDLRTGRIVADHVWLTQGKRFMEAGELKSGDFVEFAATVRPYVKGYVNEHLDLYDRSIDYRLSNPFGVKRVEKRKIETKPLSTFLWLAGLGDR